MPLQSQSWIRPDKPIVSNSPPPQTWMRSNIYCPRVIYAEGKYRMWMNASPSPEDSWETVYGYVYEYWSDDGIDWTRGDQPAVQATGNSKSCVYPARAQDR